MKHSVTHGLVSVVLPTYNRAHTLRRAVDSVLAQTYTDLELLIVDDGSTDETPQLLESYHDPRIRRIQSPGRRGAGGARNLGLAQARGEFVAFQDSDDAWLIEKLAKQVAHLQSHPDAAAGACGYYVINNPPNLYPGYCGAVMLNRDCPYLSLFKYGYQLSTPAWLVRRQVLDRVGHFEESLKTWEDWELSIRIDAAGGFVHLDEPLYLVFETPGSVKGKMDAYAETLEFAMRRHAAHMTTSSRILAQHYWMMGTWERAVGRYANARKYLVQAIRHDPTYWRPWATFARRAPQLLLP